MYSPKMYAVCLRLSSSREDAKDNLQDTFIQVFDKIKQFKNKGSFEGWVRRIATNVCLAKMRKSKFFVIADEKIPEEEQEESWDKEDLVIYDIEKIKDIIYTMPDAYKTIFNLYVIEEYSHKEIAEMVGISIGTSKSNLSRAKNWLRNELRKNNITVNAQGR